MRTMGPMPRTGPNTPEGKENSSKNALKHGCRSKRLLVGDETQEEFDALEEAWRREYGSEGQATESWLRRTIERDWDLRRSERNYEAVEVELAAIPPMQWSDEQHHKLELFLRYRTTQERSFQRAFTMLNQLQKDKQRDEMVRARIQQQAEKIAREQAKKAAKEKEEEEAIYEPPILVITNRDTGEEISVMQQAMSEERKREIGLEMLRERRRRR